MTDDINWWAFFLSFLAAFAVLCCFRRLRGMVAELLGHIRQTDEVEWRDEWGRKN